MWRDLKTAFVALALMTLLTGLAYPLAITGLAQLAFPRRANGSLVVEGGVVRGSELVGQSWSGERWFHGRPSATGPTPYEARASSGSNLGPSSPGLAEAFAVRARDLRAQGLIGDLPVDLLTASGSGLDPHVTPRAADAQVARVAAARGLSADRVRALVAEHVEPRSLGVLGEPRVNVLALNLALERLR